MSIENKHIVYFLGIGGIGMSALARWFMHTGKKVLGYDKTKTPLTTRLEEEGALIHYDDAIENIPAEVLSHRDDVLVIWTPALPADHRELNYLKNNRFPIYKRSEVLGFITNQLFSVAVAGTHGKTTTSSMIAHILKTAGRSTLGLMGGILQGYESNLIIEGEGKSDTIAVLEADEYDRSFLRLSPDISVVTSADPDHLDIYGTHEEMKATFREFAMKTKDGGHLYAHNSLSSWLLDEQRNIINHTYGLTAGESHAANIHVDDTDFVFDFHGKTTIISQVRLPMPGQHNVENAVAAIAVALQLGIEKQSILHALATFRGVKRRFEYHIKTDKLVYIDDYAHHPAEISAFMTSVKTLYPGRKITAIFQPHLFTRTRDFAEGFAGSLEPADEIILMDIYPAREQPIEGVTTKIIYDKIKNPHKSHVSDGQLLDKIAATTSDVFLTIGAGNIDRFVQPIKKLLEQRI